MEVEKTVEYRDQYESHMPLTQISIRIVSIVRSRRQRFDVDAGVGQVPRSTNNSRSGNGIQPYGKLGKMGVKLKRQLMEAIFSRVGHGHDIGPDFDRDFMEFRQQKCRQSMIYPSIESRKVRLEDSSHAPMCKSITSRSML